MKRILFITPYFHRSGSELVLYNIISRLDKSKYDIAIAITKTKGELTGLLPDYIKKFVYTDFVQERQAAIENKNRQTIYRIYRFFTKLFNPDKIFAEEQKPTYKAFFTSINDDFRADVWYINTILQPYAVDISKELNIPCIVHSHEMEQMFAHLNSADLDNLIKIPKLIIACSSYPARALQTCGRTKDIEICYPCIDLKTIKPNESIKQDLKKKLNIDDKTYIWAMSGMLDINKNPVKFVDICNEIISQGHNVHFIWFGGGSESGYSEFAKKKAISLGIDANITWTGKLTSDYYDYLNLANGFVLTSANDSFPLVLIESAYMGKPIVGFSSGGINEFFGSGNNQNICSVNDVQSIVKIMIDIMSGKISYNIQEYKKRAEEFDVVVQFPLWENVISKYI